MIFSPASLATSRRMAAHVIFWVAGPKASGTATRSGQLSG
jgi:hypothetical protein